MRGLVCSMALAGLWLISLPASAQDKPQDAPDKTPTALQEPTYASNFERDLATAKAQTDPDLKFRGLRRMRSDIGRSTEETKSRLVTIRQDLELKQRARKAFEDEKKVSPPPSLEALNKAFALATDRSTGLQKQLELLKPDDPRYNNINNQLNQVSSEMGFLQYQISQVPVLEAAAKARDANIKALDEAIAKLQAEEGRLPAIITRQLTDQSTLDDEINDVLRTENQRNWFKTWIALAFTMLVLVVIAGFFATAWRDEVVRRAIFSSESGIQFLTLFSVVIAIILFGITGILESKELAALLGGLSGYILGRVTGK